MDWQGDNEMRRHQRADVNKRGHVQPAGVASGISRALDVEARASRVLLTASQIFQCRAWKTAASAVLVAFAITVSMIVACLYTANVTPICSCCDAMSDTDRPHNANNTSAPSGPSVATGLSHTCATMRNMPSALSISRMPA